MKDRHMADDSKPVYIPARTPRGIAKWPKLTEPDYGTDKFPNAGGQYSVKLVFKDTDPKFLALAAKIEPLMAEAEANAKAEFATLKKATRDQLGAPKKNPWFSPLYDENDEPTGEVEMKLSMAASGVVKRGPRAGKEWKARPDYFDAFGRKITNTKGLEIWGGSELICSFSITKGGYFIPGTGAYGLQIKLQAVQIVKLRSPGANRTAEGYGFGVEDDGWSADELSETTEDDDEDGDDDYGSAGGGGAASDPDGSSDF